MTGELLRISATTIAGGVLAMIVAANWSDPNDPLAGVLIGFAGPAAGLLLGVAWQVVHEARAKTSDGGTGNA